MLQVLVRAASDSCFKAIAPWKFLLLEAGVSKNQAIA